MERKSIGTFIAALRRANGMTQKDLAEKLSVSDKAVSRWERDESLPDLMLLPVIADTFHITVDELLRGERKVETAATEEKQDTAAEMARLKKQTRRVLNVQLGRLRNRNCIALGVGAVGVLAAIICNFALSRGFVGFCVGVVCVALAAVMAVFFQQGAMQAADDEDFDEESVRWYKESVIAWGKRMAVMLSAMLSFCLPMVVAVEGMRYGYIETFVEAASWLKYSAVCLSVIETVLSLAFWRINLRLQDKGLARKTANINLHGWCVSILCGVMVLTVLSRALMPSIRDRAMAEGMVFDSIEAFQTEMENRYQEDLASGAYENSKFYNQDGQIIPVDEALKGKLYGRGGEVLCEYYMAESVRSIQPTVYSDGRVEIHVYDDYDYMSAQFSYEAAVNALTMVFVLEPLMAFGIYLVLRTAGRESI